MIFACYFDKKEQKEGLWPHIQNHTEYRLILVRSSGKDDFVIRWNILDRDNTPAYRAVMFSQCERIFWREMSRIDPVVFQGCMAKGWVPLECIPRKLR